MLESIFIVIVMMAFILFVLAVFDENVIFAATSFLLWMIIFAQSFYIEVPCDTYYTEYGLNAISLAFIFINLIWMLVLHFDWQKKLP